MLNEKFSPYLVQALRNLKSKGRYEFETWEIWDEMIKVQKAEYRNRKKLGLEE